MKNNLATWEITTDKIKSIPVDRRAINKLVFLREPVCCASSNLTRILNVHVFYWIWKIIGQLLDLRYK